MPSIDLSRRDVLRLGAAAAAAFAVPSIALAEDRFRRLQSRHAELHLPQIQARTGDQENRRPRRCITLSFSAGHVPVESTPDQIKAVLSLCKDNGITAAGVRRRKFTKNHDANKKKFEFGAALGIKIAQRRSRSGQFRQPRQAVRRIQDRHRHPSAWAGQGEGHRHRWWSAEIILKAVKDHNPLIGTCLDTGHLIRMAQLGETARSGPANQASWAPAISACTSRTTTIREKGRHFRQGRRRPRHGCHPQSPQGSEIQRGAEHRISRTSPKSRPKRSKRCVAVIKEAVEELGEDEYRTKREAVWLRPGQGEGGQSCCRDEIAEQRGKRYNGTVLSVKKCNSDLMVIRVKPDFHASDRICRVNTARSASAIGSRACPAARTKTSSPKMKRRSLAALIRLAARCSTTTANCWTSPRPIFSNSTSCWFARTRTAGRRR